jgi:hypothetical protein
VQPRPGVVIRERGAVHLVNRIRPVRPTVRRTTSAERARPKQGAYPRSKRTLAVRPS